MEEKVSIEDAFLVRVSRSNQANAVFSVIKGDMNFRRFIMGARKNAVVVWHLVSMAYNIRFRQRL